MIFILLFVVSCFPFHTATKDGMENLLNYCCSLGKAKSNQALECKGKTLTPINNLPVEHYGICFATIDLCCGQSIQSKYCDAGIDAAKIKGNCDLSDGDSCKSNYKHCCEACKLGLISKSMGIDCKLKTFHFGSTWDAVYESCCILQSSTVITPPRPRNTPENYCELLPGELCAHICVSIGVGSYRCECRPGFTLMADEKSCQPDTVENRCEKNNPCEQNCFDNGLALECSCNPGYELHNDNHSCVDIDECNENLHTCKNITEICSNTHGSYQCSPRRNLTRNPVPRKLNCSFGFTFNVQTNECIDVDECHDTPCERNEICENTQGGYICKCQPGFQHDNTGACVDINECQQNSHNCLPSQRCDNTVGSFHCVRLSDCGTGYTLNVETQKCEDDDECALGTDNCRFVGGGLECRNTAGSFRCERKRCNNCTNVITPRCPKGYQLRNSICKDINECDNSSACGASQSCINTPGGFQCISIPRCTTGLRLNDIQTQCVDINECSEQPTICDHNCVNLWGTFKCFCNTGYMLHDDKRSCIDINECDIYQGRRLLCNGMCVNQLGSYKCQCPDGYRLGLDNATCIDIDECASGSTCSNDDTCLNIGGSFRCNSIICPPNYVKDADHKNRCVKMANFCVSSSQECLQMPLSYSYNYITFVSNIIIPVTRQLELFQMRGPTSSSVSTDFSLNLESVQAPSGVPKATNDYFQLNQVSSSKVIVSLIRSIQGPQDIQLNLNMNLSFNGVFAGYTVSKLFIFVSQYEY